MTLTNEQTSNRYRRGVSLKTRRRRSWRIQQTLEELDWELSRVLPQWEREVKGMLPVERKPATVWDWNQSLRDDPAVTKTMLAVAFVIGTYADSKTGENTFVTDDTVGAAVGIKRQNVNPLRRKLEKAGYLQETARRPGGSVTYRLTVPVCQA